MSMGGQRIPLTWHFSVNFHVVPSCNFVLEYLLCYSFLLWCKIIISLPETCSKFVFSDLGNPSVLEYPLLGQLERLGFQILLPCCEG